VSTKSDEVHVCVASSCGSKHSAASTIPPESVNAESSLDAVGFAVQAKRHMAEKRVKATNWADESVESPRDHDRQKPNRRLNHTECPWDDLG